MKIDFSRRLHDVFGNVDPGNPTLGLIVGTALQDPLPDDATLAPDKKDELGLLARKIGRDGREIDLPIEQIAIIKQRVGRRFPAGIVTPVFDILEGRDVPVSETN